MTAADQSRGATVRRIDWSAAVLAGVIVGIGFAGLEMILSVLLFRGLVARQVRMTAAIILGEEVLASTANFDLRILLAALAVHLALSIVYAIVLAWLILHLRFGAAEVVGLGFGLVLYLVNFYALAHFFPWFREERNWLSVVTHLAFGVIAALEYKAFARRRKEAGVG
jgi:hypothetical protein